MTMGVGAGPGIAIAVSVVTKAIDQPWVLVKGPLTIATSQFAKIQRSK